ncbi:MAG TPA: 2-amino-4-hydroxy-6-hydroxymethyldihydropteridine diphosphokinase [Acidobacteriaceae bacterium]|nr:2-amino-4-hydroxy-6-hydroxymethyldihydropteridine diphosphokinase [Acidobacteriaceae bacterium]
MSLAAIALGSNLGDREVNLRDAIARIGALGSVRAVSSFYDTAPVGYIEQPRFLNAALLLETALSPLDLMAALLSIERALGRDRTMSPAKGPRTVDLDLLLYDGLTIHTPASGIQPALTLPHPEMHLRGFVLAPLAEIAPEMVDPASGRTIAQMLAELSIGRSE